MELFGEDSGVMTDGTQPPRGLVGVWEPRGGDGARYSMFPRAMAGCGHGFSNCMREQPGETLTAQVSIIPAAATRLSYNSPGPGLEASPRVQVFSINFHVGRCIGSTFWFRAFTFFCRLPPSVPVSICY